MERENNAVMNDAIIIGMIVDFVQFTNLDIIRISLIVLIDGGAEMFIAIKINHQNTMFGVIVINPLNIIMFREWIFIYRSFTSRNKADDDIPWAIIIIIAPINPILFIEKILDRTNPIWATEE